MTQFNFQNARGKTLAGRLEQPASAANKVAIFAHCFSCSKNVHAATRVSRELAKRGITVLRFDFTGLGNSEGDFANTNFSSNVDDLVAAADALRERHQAPALLIGHSLGGAAVLMAAKKIVEVEAVATIGAPSEPAHVSHLFGDRTACIEKDGAALIRIGGRDLRIEKHFLDDLKTHQLTKLLPTLGKPLMIFHSPIDSVVSIEHARKLYEAAKHPKSFVSLDDADHMLSRKDDAEFVAATLAAWASRNVSDRGPDSSGGSTANSDSVTDQVAAGSIEVSEINGGLAQRVRTSTHEFRADEPPSVPGGAGSGPDPYELLLASLGACTSMTLRMYLKRKKWPAESISIRLAHERIHAKDCEDCGESGDSAGNGFVDLIRKKIVIKGDLDSQQLQRLHEIADRCPVHRTLMNEKRIQTEIHRK